MKKQLVCLLSFVAFFTVNGIHASTLTLGAVPALRDPLKQLSEEFHQQHPEHSIQVSFASSGALYQQMSYGSQFDMVALDHPLFIEQAIDNQLIVQKNSAVIGRDLVVMATLNPNIHFKLSEQPNTSTINESIKHLSIPNPQLTSIGYLAKTVLNEQGWWDSMQVKALEAKDAHQSYNFIANSAADVGVVFLSDIKTLEPRLTVLDTLPGYVNYVLAPTTTSDNINVINLFIDFILSPKGQEIIKKNALLSPQ